METLTKTNAFLDPSYADNQGIRLVLGWEYSTPSHNNKPSFSKLFFFIELLSLKEFLLKPKR
jgi:hypothetical protein